ncbi:type II secretion system protein [Clostridium sp. WILCCON 0269]|uniref:Type II secretion system protein n=1 Tax=Candidatus Clostridium eludens TaxID=3381663 RepID=A0ABW8SIC5_9CLOT
MKNKGFTYIEIMMAIAIFLILSAFIVRLNITSNKNMNTQVQQQNMMMEAQKLLEKFKTTTTSVGNYANNDYEPIDGYYVVVQYEAVSGFPNLLQITVRVRENVSDANNEVVLTSHFLKN